MGRRGPAPAPTKSMRRDVTGTSPSEQSRGSGSAIAPTTPRPPHTAPPTGTQANTAAQPEATAGSRTAPAFRIGRPSKYHPETVAAIVAALTLGNTRTDSALIAGINRDTFHEWMKVYPAFSVEVERAEARARQRAVAQLAKAGSRDWRAALAFLERRDRDNWGRQERVDISLDADAEIKRIAAETGVDEASVRAEIDAILSRYK